MLLLPCLFRSPPLADDADTQGLVLDPAALPWHKPEYVDDANADAYADLQEAQRVRIFASAARREEQTLLAMRDVVRRRVSSETLADVLESSAVRMEAQNPAVHLSLITMSRAVYARVFLELFVKVQDDWRSKPNFIEDLDWRRQLEQIAAKQAEEENSD